ncbi:MAG: restriction endonuclease subunit S, partial [Bacteroides sp.]|nr:restriction endonuclease subunit S [Bacteroides sp.]
MTRPKIRFKGFEQEWKERSLSNKEFTITAGGDANKSLLKTNGKYPVIANALSNDGIIGYYNHGYRIKGPAVTVTGRGDIGFAQSRHYSFTPVVRLLSIQSDHDVDFLANAINCHTIVRESTGVAQLTIPQLSK